MNESYHIRMSHVTYEQVPHRKCLHQHPPQQQHPRRPKRRSPRHEQWHRQGVQMLCYLQSTHKKKLSGRKKNCIHEKRSTKKTQWATNNDGCCLWSKETKRAMNNNIGRQYIYKYGVAAVSGIDKSIGLFCRISSLLQVSFAKETYNFIDPTNQSHPIHIYEKRPLKKTQRAMNNDECCLSQ